MWMCFRNQVLAQEHAQQLGAEETLDEADIEIRKSIEGAVGGENAAGDQQMDVGVKVQQLNGRLDELHRTRHRRVVIEAGEYPESEGAPSAAGEIPHEGAVVAEVDPQALGDGEDHLAMGNVLQDMLGSPLSPQEFALGMAGGQMQRSLQEKATKKSWPHSPQRTRAKPLAKMPQSR